MKGTIRDKLLKLQQGEFIGRQTQLQSFSDNLRRKPEDLKNIFNIFGLGGVGKTFLLRKFEQIAAEQGALHTYTDEGIKDIPQFMNEVAEQLEKQSFLLKAFRERYHVYRRIRRELEADPEAPKGFAAFLSRTIVKGGINLVNQLPGGTIVMEFSDENYLSTQLGEWDSYVAQKLADEDDVQLVLEPEKILAPLWLEGLGQVAENRKICLLIDTYEEVERVLDAWLRDILMTNLSDGVILVIAGRNKLDADHWNIFHSITASFPLEPFTEEESLDYLNHRGISDPRIAKAIMELSGRLPILLATLAETPPVSADHLEDVTTTAISLFLKWENDPVKRDAALYGAVPRYLNRDILAQIAPPEKNEELFSWLQSRPFVQKRADRWAYHPVVRELMLAYLRRLSPQKWSELHRSLAAYFEQEQQNTFDREEPLLFFNETWQDITLHRFYHLFCEAPTKCLPMALNGFLNASKVNVTYAEKWADFLRHAEKDSESPEPGRWGKGLYESLKGMNEQQYSPMLVVLTTLLKYKRLYDNSKAVALAWRGNLYLKQSQYEQSLRDLNEALSIDPDYAWAWAVRGDTYRMLNRFDDALADLNKALELNPDSDYALNSRGEAQRLLGRFDEAIADLNKSLAINAKSDFALASRGVAYGQLSRFDAALADLNLAVEINPKNIWALNYRGITYRLLGRYEDSIADFDKILETDPNYEWASYNKGESYRMMNRFEEAFLHYNKALAINPSNAGAIAGRGAAYVARQRYDEALADLNKALEISPNYDWAYYSRGDLYRQMSRYDEAIADLNKAIEINPKYEWSYYARGETYRMLNRSDEALADLNKGLEINPNHAGLLGGRGATLYSLQRYEEALADLNRALEIDPNYHWAFYWRGETYRILNRFDESLADLNKALEANNKDHFALASRGAAYSMLQRLDESLADLNRALEISPNYEWALLSRGVAHRMMNRFDESLADMNRALEINPNYDWVFHARGETYRMMIRFDEALADLNKFIGINPRRDWGYQSRGEVFRMLNDYDQALADLNKALEINPDNALALGSRGAAYGSRHEYEKALADLNKAIELNPPNEWAVVTRGWLYGMMYMADKALAAFEEVLERNPRSDVALYQRGVLYRLMGRLSESLDDHNKALDINPTYGNYMALASRGITYRRLNRLEESLDDLRKALVINPKYEWASAQLALTFLLLGRYGEAKESIEKAIGLELKKNYLNHFILSLCCQKPGDTKPAKRHFEAAQAMLNDDLNRQPAVVQFQIHQCYYHAVAGRAAEAQALAEQISTSETGHYALLALAAELEYYLTLFPGHETGEALLRWVKAASG